MWITFIAHIDELLSVVLYFHCFLWKQGLHNCTFHEFWSSTSFWTCWLIWSNLRQMLVSFCRFLDNRQTNRAEELWWGMMLQLNLHLIGQRIYMGKKALHKCSRGKYLSAFGAHAFWGCKAPNHESVENQSHIVLLFSQGNFLFADFICWLHMVFA